MNYYNEHDPKAAAWLRELIRDGAIPGGIVDERDIQQVRADDLDGFTQCHFFAGIGGWSYALRLAGWPDSKPVWTGSCPCQPFSAAGKGLGKKDPRHLWPQFRRLIRQRRPATVFGEQVASAAGRDWLDGVFADLESLAYVNSAADLCAAGVGAPHIRQRLFWGATDWLPHTDLPSSNQRTRSRKQPLHSKNENVGGMANTADGDGRGGVGGAETGIGANGIGRRGSASGGVAGGLGGSHGAGLGEQRRAIAVRAEQPAAELRGDAGKSGGGLDNTSVSRHESARDWESEQSERRECLSGLGCAWSDFALIPCRDGKSRRIESGTFPLAHGIPGRVGLLRGYGNAIVPQVAAEFIQAYLEMMNAQP